MANLKTFSGFPIQNLSSDPVPYAQALADNPYAGTWASGGVRNNASGALGGSIIGTQTSAVAAGGNISGTIQSNAETYNGSSWAEGNNLNTARREIYAGGVTTAGFVAGGDTSASSSGQVNNTETYNGTSFTEANNLNTARNAGSGAGLLTAGLAISGGTGPGSPNYVNNVESWNGSSWSEIAEINTTRIRAGASGIQTSALYFGGSAAPGNQALTELWNGSSWTEVNDLNSARAYVGSAGTLSTAALIFGGGSVNTESYNGSSWTEVNNLATSQADNFGVVSGTNTSALSSGGETAPIARTEEWSFSGINPATTPAADYSDAIVGQMYYNSTSGQFKAVKDGGAPLGTWASGGTLNTAKVGGSSGGTQTALVYAGGYDGSGATNTSETYNGTAWTEGNNLNTGRTD